MRTQSVHRIPRSTFVTTRNAPPDERGTGLALLLFLSNEKAKYFLQEDWTRRANQCRRVTRAPACRMGGAATGAAAFVIASAGEAIHGATSKGWIASSHSLLAMTRIACRMGGAKAIPIAWRATGAAASVVIASASEAIHGRSNAQRADCFVAIRSSQSRG